MYNFIDQSAYSKLNIGAGIYGLIITTNNQPAIPNGCYPTGARTLITSDGGEDVLNLTLLHQKKGVVNIDNALTIYKDQFPIHVVSCANILAAEEEALHESIKSYQAVMDNINTRKHTGYSGSSATESGFVI